MDLDELTLASFQPHVGEGFAIAAPAGVELVLASAEGIGEWPGGRQPFSLTFHGPREPLLAQATYRMQHATLGAVAIFIVPIGRDADGTSYEAIFT